MRGPSRAWLALPATLLLAACGHAARAPSPASTGAGVFAHSCANCHSLIGNESRRKQGGDLLGYALTRAQLLGFTRVMPTRPLSQAELEAVVSYILQRQARRH